MLKWLCKTDESKDFVYNPETDSVFHTDGTLVGVDDIFTVVRKVNNTTIMKECYSNDLAIVMVTVSPNDHEWLNDLLIRTTIHNSVNKRDYWTVGKKDIPTFKEAIINAKYNK